MIGRDNKGRFVKANKIGKGRPPKTEEREIISALEGVVPLGVALEKLAIAIKNGEEWAIKLYFAYRWHLPTQPVQSDFDGNMVIRVVYEDDTSLGEAATSETT